MNTHQPQITTIICTYRRPQLLRRAIESVLNQTYQDFRISIYDNASGDETSDIVREFLRKDSRITYHCHTENIGLLENYSYAMQQVSTEFFSFLGDDDLILPNFYTVALAGFEQEPSAFFVASSYRCLSLQGNDMGGRIFENRVLHKPDGVFDLIKSNINPNLHGTLMRKEVLSEFTEFKYLWSDIELLYQIVAKHTVVLRSEECLISTIHNMDKDKDRKTIIDHAWLMPETVMAKLKPIMLKDDYDRLDAIFDKKIKNNLYLFGIDLIYKRDFFGAAIGAKKLRNKYRDYLHSFILDLLIFIFKKFPFILNLLISVRDIRPYIKGQQHQPQFLNYDQVIEIYYSKKY
jgi:glycosyltransferase involved in cell wall biosynthesis